MAVGLIFSNSNNYKKCLLIIFFLVGSQLLVFLTPLHMAQSSSPSPASEPAAVYGGAEAVFPLQDANIDCGASCSARCQLSSRPRLCKRACGTCCTRCNCVPPGTAGNEQICPCYANMTTHGGRHKCP